MMSSSLSPSRLTTPPHLQITPPLKQKSCPASFQTSTTIQQQQNITLRKMASLKGPGEAQQHDGSGLRIAIVHARWNMTIIEPLVAGAKAKLLASGVQEHNIIIQSVPGSWELPIAVQRLYSASQIQSSTHPTHGGGGASSSSLLLGGAGDLLGPSASATDLSLSLSTAASASASGPAGSASTGAASVASTAPFDAVIAVGVLIKGETMHFEYIAEAVSHGLMRVQLDTGVPLIFGLLTVLNEDQAKARAGISGGSHNHGDDWGLAAVELGARRRQWGEGKIV